MTYNQVKTDRNKIIIYSWNIPKGGLAKVILKEYNFFISMHKKVTLLTSDPIPGEYSADLPETIITVLSQNESEVNNHRSDISQFFPGLKITINSGIIRSGMKLFNYLKKEKPKIIITHQLLSAYLCLPFSLLFNRPFCIILHDNPFSFIEKSSVKNMNRCRRFSVNLAYLLANVVIQRSKYTICTTRQIKLNVEKHLKVRKKLVVAEYGIDQYSKKEKIPRELLLTVSKWSKFRNPVAYLEVIKLLPNETKLTFAGRWDSNEELLAFKDLVRRMNLENRIEVINDMSESELLDLYDRTKVFLRLGFNEMGSGQAILEALGHGCPVVISKHLGAADLIENGKEGFLVDERDLGDVAQKVTQILLDDIVYRNMSNSAYELAMRNGWDKYLETIYRITTA